MGKLRHKEAPCLGQSLAESETETWVFLASVHKPLPALPLLLQTPSTLLDCLLPRTHEILLVFCSSAPSHTLTHRMCSAHTCGPVLPATGQRAAKDILATKGLEFRHLRPLSETEPSGSFLEVLSFLSPTKVLFHLFSVVTSLPSDTGRPDSRLRPIGNHL